MATIHTGFSEDEIMLIDKLAHKQKRTRTNLVRYCVLKEVEKYD